MWELKKEGFEFGEDECTDEEIYTMVMLACVASVSNRVIARKLEREQKKVGGGGEKRIPLPLPRHSFFALVPTFSTNSRGNACYAGYGYVARQTPLFYV